MLPPHEEWHLDTRRLGRRTLYFEKLDSTNTLAAAFGRDPAHDGLAVLAREQTAGRGQHGRSWAAPGGSSVLLSLLLFPPPALRRPAVLTAWAAVAVCELIDELTELRATIKWPNDVLVRGKKVCGILIEQRSHGPHLATVVGMGLNVSQTPDLFTDAGLPQATSLAASTGREFDFTAVARRLVARLDAEYTRLTDGDWTTLEASWRERLGLLGRPVLLEGLQRDYCGRLTGLTFAEVELETPGGERLRLSPEAVRHIRRA